MLPCRCGADSWTDLCRRPQMRELRQEQSTWNINIIPRPSCWVKIHLDSHIIHSLSIIGRPVAVLCTSVIKPYMVPERRRDRKPMQVDRHWRPPSKERLSADELTWYTSIPTWYFQVKSYSDLFIFFSCTCVPCTSLFLKTYARVMISRYRDFNILVKLTTFWGWKVDSMVNLLEYFASVSSTYIMPHNCL